MVWGEKKEVKKGDLGEAICRRLLEDDEYVVYKPVTENKPHLIDFFCHKSNKSIIGAEVKAKKRTIKNYWHTGTSVLRGVPGTGFNTRNAKEYYRLLKKNNIDTKLFFVDDFEKCIYGGWFSKLIKTVKKMETSDQVVFRLDEMEVFYWLSDEEVKQLKTLSRSNYDYSRVERFFKKS